MSEENTPNDNATPGNAIPGVDPRLLEITVCPQTKTQLIYDEAQNELVSAAAGVAYPVKDGIPIMLIDEARPLTDVEITNLKKARPGAT